MTWTLGLDQCFWLDRLGMDPRQTLANTDRVCFIAALSSELHAALCRRRSRKAVQHTQAYQGSQAKRLSSWFFCCAVEVLAHLVHMPKVRQDVQAFSTLKTQQQPAMHECETAGA